MSTDANAAQETRQMVVVTLGADDYGVPLAAVREILRHVPPRPLPGAPAHVPGVINLRGRIIPVIDLRVRLGVDAPPSPEPGIVIVDGESVTMGLIVDRVREVITAATDRCDGPADREQVADCIEGFSSIDGRPLAIIDVARLVRDVT